MSSPFAPPPLRLGTTPAQTAKGVRALRAALIDAIAARLRQHLDNGSTQAELSELLGLSRPRMSRLLRRDVELFGLDSLAVIAARSGFTVRLSVASPYHKR